MFVEHVVQLVRRLRLRPKHVARVRSEEHTSELQSQSNLVCRLLLEKKKLHHLLKFLQTPPQVLLVQRPPGSGKTTFAPALIHSLEATHTIYASIMVDPASLRQYFPC